MLRGIIQRGVEEYGKLTCQQVNSRRRAVFLANLNMPQSRLLGLLLTFPVEFGDFLRECGIPATKPVLVSSSNTQGTSCGGPAQLQPGNLRAVGS